MLKTLTRSFLALCLALGVAVAAQKPLVVGMELQYPPFEMTDKDGNPAGVSVDMAKELGKHLGREVKIENIAWDGLIPSLKTKKIDLIISSMTITEQRKKTIDFSIPYSKSYLTLLIAKDSPVMDINDLNAKGRKVAVKKGTTGHLYADKSLPMAETLVFDKENAAVLEVVQGKADAFIYDTLTIFRQWQNHQETTRLNLRPFQKNFEYWGVAIRKGNDELREQVNGFIRTFRKNGGYDRLAEKHLTMAKKKFDSMGIPFFFNIEE